MSRHVLTEFKGLIASEIVSQRLKSFKEFQNKAVIFGEFQKFQRFLKIFKDFYRFPA